MPCDFPLVVVFATSTSGRFVKLQPIKFSYICLPTEHQGVHKNSFRNVRAFQDRIGEALSARILTCNFSRKYFRTEKRLITERPTIKPLLSLYSRVSRCFCLSIELARTCPSRRNRARNLYFAGNGLSPRCAALQVAQNLRRLCFCCYHLKQFSVHSLEINACVFFSSFVCC